MKTGNWKKNLARHVIFYVIDMVAATIGFIYGFGLEVKSWSALIGMMLVARLLTHTLHNAFFYGVARQRVEDEKVGAA